MSGDRETSKNIIPISTDQINKQKKKNSTKSVLESSSFVWMVSYKVSTDQSFGSKSFLLFGTFCLFLSLPDVST